MTNPLIEKFYELNPNKKPEEQVEYLYLPEPEPEPEPEVKFNYDPANCIHIGSALQYDTISTGNTSSAYSPYYSNSYTTYGSSLIVPSLNGFPFKTDHELKVHVAKELSSLLTDHIVRHILENNLIEKKKNVITGEEEYTVKIKVHDFN